MGADVKRWSAGWRQSSDGKITAIPDDEGAYVLHADYAALEAENARLREACLVEHGGKHHEPECPICAALAVFAAQEAHDAR